MVGVEENEEFVREAQDALAAQQADNVAVVAGPLAAGMPKHGPYDVITLQGAVETLPQAIVDQLKEGGRIGCIFMEGALGTCRIGHKIGGLMSWRYAFNATAPVLPGFSKTRGFVL